MKKLFSIALLSAISIGSYGQNKQTAPTQPMAATVAPHFPKTATEANLATWVEAYPEEASKYHADLLQQMQTKPKSGNTTEYDALKMQYSTMDRLMRQASEKKVAQPVQTR